MDDVLSAVRSCLSRHIFFNNQPFIAAVSGGADSMAMLSALTGLREELKLNFCCVHIQHNLRGEEGIADEEYVKKFCKKNNVEFNVEIIPKGVIEKDAKILGCGIEAAARTRRFALLQNAAMGFAARLWAASGSAENRVEKCAAHILIAHTKDDALEHILIRVLRGAGPAGLAALPECRALNEQCNILRPLLSLSRENIISFLAQKKIEYRVDSTNSNDVFLRNKIRTNLIPVLNKNFLGWQTALLELSRTQSLVAGELHSRAASFLKDNAEYSGGSVRVKNFFDQSAILREEIIFEAIDSIAAIDAIAATGEVSAPKKNKSIAARRAVVRDFCKGTKRVVCLGGALLTKKKTSVIISVTNAAHRLFVKKLA